MSDQMPVAKLRRRILNNRGVVVEKKTKRLLKINEQPDNFPKTSKMKMLEYKYHIKLDVILFDGSLDEVVQFLNGEIDRSTISKWRTRYHKYMKHKAEVDAFPEAYYG